MVKNTEKITIYLDTGLSADTIFVHIGSGIKPFRAIGVFFSIYQVFYYLYSHRMIPRGKMEGLERKLVNNLLLSSQILVIWGFPLHVNPWTWLSIQVLHDMGSVDGAWLLYLLQLLSTEPSEQRACVSVQSQIRPIQGRPALSAHINSIGPCSPTEPVTTLHLKISLFFCMLLRSK